MTLAYRDATPDPATSRDRTPRALRPGGWLPLLAVAIAALVGACNLPTQENAAFCCTNLDSCGMFNLTEMRPCEGELRECDEQTHFCVDVRNPPVCPPELVCPQVTPFCVDDVCHQCKPDQLEKCKENAPVCNNDLYCSGCQASSACTRFPDTPLCATDTGTCVQCLTSNDCSKSPNGPFCENNKCRPCLAHSECDSQACNLEKGTCFAEAEVIYMKPGGIDIAPCSLASQCGSTKFAVDQVTGSRKVIKFADGKYDGQLRFVNKTATVLADKAVLAAANTNQPTVSVEGASNIVIEGLTISAAQGDDAADGVRCSLTTEGRPSVTLRRVRIEGNDSHGVEALSCTITMLASRVMNNDAGGALLFKTDFVLLNNIIANNGEKSMDIGGIKIDGTFTAGGDQLQFNTIADNKMQTTGVAGVKCELPGLAADNNIVYNNGAKDSQQVTGTCSWNHSLIGPTRHMDGQSNLDAFPEFVNGAKDNYHLGPNSPAKDKADPDAQLAVDIDGDVRPQPKADSIRDIGADEIVAAPP